ncbi:MAG: VOC family protein [Xanthomonadales bacterium]|nr:VOC family protein [Xanthomonadales bacterium]
MSVSPIPEGYHSVTPYLIVKDAAKALEFYKAAFDAVTMLRLDTPDGGVAHAEMKIGDSPVMLADENVDMGALSPETVGGSPLSLMLYVENVDAVFRQAVDAGAIVHRDLENQFYGDRTATIHDPFGHHWTLATHIENVSPEELERRFQEMMS